MKRIGVAAFIISLSLVTLGQTPSVFAQATPKEDLHVLEAKYQENALSAKKSYTGATVKFQVFVTKVDEEKREAAPANRHYLLQ